MNQAKNAPFILTVSQLTQAIKLQLEGAFPTVWLKGEVSNSKVQSSGHMYFSIIDPWAQISAVMFKMDLAKLQFPVKNGDQILIRGELNVWAPKGNYQIIVRELSLVGLGEQLMKLELLKQKLQSLGWFDASRKKTLPRFPKTIGVVTSPTGAVIQDILNILKRRYAGFHLILNPVKVQGDGASDEIAKAINQFNDYALADVIIVARGGGSAEDLQPFNAEIVAKAIYESTIPVVSAVGHETDTTIADLVADLRAPTPSAAAEIVSREQQVLIEALLKHHKLLYTQLKQRIVQKKQEMRHIMRAPVFNSFIPLLGSHIQRLDFIKESLENSIQRVLETSNSRLLQYKQRLELLAPWARLREATNHLQRLQKDIHNAIIRQKQDYTKKLAMISSRLDLAITTVLSHNKKKFEYSAFDEQIPLLVLKGIQQRKKEFESVSQHLISLNPKNLLRKGYTILFSQKTGSVISSIRSMSQGDAITLLLHDGEAQATVTTIVPNKSAQQSQESIHDT